ncbi:atlastin-2-like [Paramacrobiotus metropolitanus]|uniref:atlastin-2-like n=1 Tax=Paramacrobiotus metropolitanus TaxID=2943436 RepID=UPI002445D743|nr:atlastin-2-like [Paramacrobiotus metropolitanus]
MAPTAVYALAEKDGDDDLKAANVETFLQRLCQDDIKNMPISLTGIVGRFREGKSTLYNIMHRCLVQMEQNPDSFPDVNDYLFEAAVPNANLFKMSPNSHGCTQGIWITNDPYIIRSSDGTMIAVFLLDTQGLCDNESKDSLDSALFLLTSMICSCTIYNIMRVMGSDSLKTLAVFSKLASKIRNSFYTGKERVFQDLVILTRDAMLGDVQPGWKDGDMQLQQNLQKQKQKNVDTIKQVTKAFRTLRGFLMPKLAADPDEQSFTITPQSVFPEFQKHIALFLQEVLGSKLAPFQRRGDTYTCQEFAGFFKSITELFESDSIPRAENMLETMIRVEFEAGMETALAEYRAEIYKIMETSPTNDALYTHHSASKSQAKLKQSQAPIYINERARANLYLQKLDDAIEKEFELLVAQNNARLKAQDDYQKSLQTKEAELSAMEAEAVADRQRHENTIQDMEHKFQSLSEQRETERQAMRTEIAKEQAEFERRQSQMDRERLEAQHCVDKLRQEIEMKRSCSRGSWWDHIPGVLNLIDSLASKGIKYHKNYTKIQARSASQLSSSASVPTPVYTSTSVPSLKDCGPVESSKISSDKC